MDNCTYVRRWVLTGLLSLLTAAVGCAKSDGPELVPVIGEAFSRGTAAEGAIVVLHPADGSDREKWPFGFPMAKVGSDGSFVVESGPWGQGAPLGDYKLLVTWPAIPENTDPDAPEGEEPERVDDRLKGRFANPVETPLAVTVKAPETVIPRLEFTATGK